MLLDFTKEMIYISVWVAPQGANWFVCVCESVCMCLASILYVYSVTSNTFHDLKEQRANHWSLTHEIPIHTLNTLKAIFKYLLIQSRTD